MKAPDKIYVHIKDNPPEITWSEVKANGCINEEYIRKDALLEWAKTERAKCSDETHPYAQFMNVVIYKLNSM